MVQQVINKINEQADKYEKHGSEWNIAQQLIDILVDNPSQAEIVMRDLEIQEMTVEKMVSSIVSKCIQNPFTTMKEICNFYSIGCPVEKPPEQWCNKTPILQSTAQRYTKAGLADLL